MPKSIYFIILDKDIVQTFKSSDKNFRNFISKMYCDGIREPVSGSFLYGNNISAPRSSLFRPKMGTYYDYIIRTVIGSGQGVTLLAENSMPNKTLWDDNIHSSPGSELNYLWLKLNCLKEDIFYLSAQILRTVSFQWLEKLNEYCSQSKDIILLMMCTIISHILAFYLMKNLIGSNGKPKDNIHSSPSVSMFKRIMKTLGSSSLQILRVCSHTCKAMSGDDGVAIVLAKQERATGKITEDDEDTIRMDDSNLPPENNKKNSNDFIRKIIKNWKVTLRANKGVTVPILFSKLVKLCQSNTKCKVHEVYPLLLNPAMYDLAYGQIKSNPGNMTKGGEDNTTLDG